MSRDSDIIAAQEAKVAGLRRNLEIEEGVLRGMRLVAHPDVKPANLEPEQSIAVENWNRIVAGSRRGRQPGAISREWRNTLGTLYRECPDRFSISDAVVAAQANGLKAGTREAEDRIRAYLDVGYVERAGDGFKVGQVAVQKYGFAQRQTQEAPTAV